MIVCNIAKTERDKNEDARRFVSECKKAGVANLPYLWRRWAEEGRLCIITGTVQCKISEIGFIGMMTETFPLIWGQ